MAALVGSASAAEPWTFVVISDLHVPQDGSPDRRVDRLVGAILSLDPKPRFVVVTGDMTNGNPRDSRFRVRWSHVWWRTVRATLQPLRDAGIAILPLAGNHDAHREDHRRQYAAAWADLDAVA